MCKMSEAFNNTRIIVIGVWKKTCQTKHCTVGNSMWKFIRTFIARNIKMMEYY